MKWEIIKTLFLFCKMQTYDIINSSFIFIAGFFYILNLFKLRKDKDVKGISKLSIVFFSCWNFWTFYFFIATTDFVWTQFSYGFVSIINLLYLTLLLYYIKNQPE